MHEGPRADAVRLALPVESTHIARIQRDSWTAGLDVELSRSLLAATDLGSMTASWTSAVTRPPDARCRVLVALAEGAVVGFAATRPDDDPDAAPDDGAVTELTVQPSARQRGHGSRLINACVDTLRADGFRRARCWVPTTDDGLRRFLAESGWAPDGAHREVGTEDGSVRLRQVRLHTDLTAP